METMNYNDVYIYMYCIYKQKHMHSNNLIYNFFTQSENHKLKKNDPKDILNLVDQHNFDFF